MPEAVAIGPVVIATSRLIGALALMALILVAELQARRGNQGFASWGWGVAVITLLAARLGFVIENYSAYLSDPITILYLWQGGFSPWWGIAAAASYSLWRTLREPQLARGVASAGALSLALWIVPLSLLNASASEEMRLEPIAVQTLSEEATTLDAFAGQPAVVNIWATWCPPCVRELPMMLDVKRSHDDVTFLFVNQSEGASRVRSFFADIEQEPDGVVLDPSGQTATAYRAIALPTTLFFDSGGRLQARHVGEISRAELLRQVRNLP